MPHAQPSIALGIALWGQLALLLTGAAHLYSLLPDLAEPLVPVAVCATPVALADFAGDTLACADEPRLATCGAAALDRVALTPKGCFRQPHGMAQIWRVGLGFPLDINVADAAALQSLPGVGPATASAIVATRARLGHFARTADLSLVPGVGPERLATLAPWVSVIK
jgi:competence ComEA-like helix-hairpin-helix protein